MDLQSIAIDRSAIALLKKNLMREKWDLNPHLQPWQGCTLTIKLFPLTIFGKIGNRTLATCLASLFLKPLRFSLYSSKYNIFGDKGNRTLLKCVQSIYFTSKLHPQFFTGSALKGIYTNLSQEGIEPSTLPSWAAHSTNEL